jgi:Arc/MetJ family transcription regulator
MKMTMHIDADLLQRVMDAYGYVSKTETVEMALRELDRRKRFEELGRRGLEMTPEELADAVDPNYDLMKMRVAEIPPKYGK